MNIILTKQLKKIAIKNLINWRLVDHRKKFINPLNSYKLNTSTQKNITIHLLSFHIICIHIHVFFTLSYIYVWFIIEFHAHNFFFLGISHRPMSCSLFHSICFSILLFLFFLFIISFVHKSDWTWFDEVVLYTQVHCQISMYHIYANHQTKKLEIVKYFKYNYHDLYLLTHAFVFLLLLRFLLMWKILFPFIMIWFDVDVY